MLYLALACSIVKGTLLRPRERRPDRPTAPHHDGPACAGARDSRGRPGRDTAGPWLLAGPLPRFPPAELPVPPLRLAGSMGPRLLRLRSGIEQRG